MAHTLGNNKNACVTGHDGSQEILRRITYLVRTDGRARHTASGRCLGHLTAAVAPSASCVEAELRELDWARKLGIPELWQFMLAVYMGGAETRMPPGVAGKTACWACSLNT